MPDKVHDPVRSRKMLDRITALTQEVAQGLGRPAVFMEVCGTHTMAIAKSGLRGLLTGSLELRSGPGCPVCVSAQEDIDKIIALASAHPDLVLGTFGDMVRVPGSVSSLEQERARGARVEIFYSPAEAVTFAAAHPQSQVVFLGVGFETTAPAIALSIAAAKKRGLKNYSVWSLHKIVPPVLESLLSDPELKIDGLLLPGHVCTVTGRKPFDFVATKYGVPAVIAGFEPLDLMEAVYLLLKQVAERRAETVNGYPRLVQEEGNRKARAVLREYFGPVDVPWRGFGMVPQSGLVLRENLAFYDAARRFPVTVAETVFDSDCACGDVLKGKLVSSECPLFAKVCTPLQPVGPCMVSTEGACAAYYQYEL